jgi:DNA-directed RNA polymerase subunit RPC12/RpoP
MTYQSTEFSFVCHKCGAEFDRSSEWQMLQVDNHMENHSQVGA